MHRFFAWLSRTPTETAELRDLRSIRVKIGIFLIFFLSFLALFGPLLYRRAVWWQRFRPDISVSGDSWHILPVGRDDLPCGNVAGPGCLAGPDIAMSRLWSAPMHREVDESALLRSRFRRRPDQYWLGTTIPVETLREARRKGANQLLLGWINAPYRIWVEGHYFGGGVGWEETEPIVLRVPVTKLLKERPLHVAIRIYGVTRTVQPADQLNAGGGGEGFVTTATENDYRNYFKFEERVRPFSLMVAYAVIALLFVFFWAAAPVKQEYFFVAMFALVSAGYQAQDVDLFKYQLHMDQAEMLRTLMGLYVAAFAAFLGLSFARVRLAAFKWGLPVALAFPPSLVAAARSGYVSAGAMIALNDARMRWIEPACWTLAGLVCLLEVWVLFEKRARGTYLRVRIQRLALFGTGLVSVGAFYFLEANRVLPATVRLFSLAQGFEHFICILFFATLALREYGEQELLVAKTPVSRYHQRPVLPERIAGALLVVDLKNSEALFRAGAREGDSGKFVETCLSHLWNAVIRHGGVVLQTEGDGLRAFFEAESGVEPLLAASRTVDDMRAELVIVEHQFREQHHLPPDLCSLHFRGGVARGEIRPIWQEKGGGRYASWVEAGSANVFVESARLMELERQVRGAAGATRIIFSESDARLLAATHGHGRWLERGLSLAGKHDKIYEVAVYVPRAEPAKMAIKEAA